MGQHAEETAFIQFMDQIPIISNRLRTNDSGIPGSTEVKNQWKIISKLKSEEFFVPAIDITVDDWLRQRNEVSIINRLKQVRKVVLNMDLIGIDGDLQEIITETENELIGSISDKLDQLIAIQKEKSIWMHIPRNLVNEKCFPELAKIIPNKNKNEQAVEVIPSTDSLDSSWTGSWSSD